MGVFRGEDLGDDGLAERGAVVGVPPLGERGVGGEDAVAGSVRECVVAEGWRKRVQVLVFVVFSTGVGDVRYV